MGEKAPANYIAEFVGTYLLIFTVGCNVSAGGAGDPVWGVTSIACVLMVMIYALGGVSGGNFNPAVSVALGIVKEMEWKEVAIYCAVQVVAGIVAGFSFVLLLSQPVTPGPTAKLGAFHWWEAGLAEYFYTFVLCFVVLNCAVSKKNKDNQFYGLAIGFSVVAGGYGAGAISGGCFNPAVALGLDFSSAWKGAGFGWGLAYTVFQLLGASTAAGLFMLVRPDHFGGDAEYSLGTRCLSEFIGTFVLVLTVGLNVNAGSPAGAWSIAAALMSMIFALGTCSGAHFNPAVTCAIVLSGRDKCSPQDGGAYVGAQLVGGILAALTYTVMWRGKNGNAPAIGPHGTFTWAQICLAELVFTFVLCYVVLCVATTKQGLSHYFGLAIGSCVTVGGFAIGGISGGSLNPAVSVGISTFGGGKVLDCVAYSAVELLAGALAAGAFFTTHPSEWSKGKGELLPIVASGREF